MRPIDGDELKKAIAELHLLEDEQKIRNYYKEHYGYSFVTDFTETLVEVFDIIDDAPTIEVPTWIPCSEREPNEFEDVLVLLSDGTKDVLQLTDYLDIWGKPKWCHASNYGGCGYAVRNNEVVAWMPLPKSYKEKDDE